MRGRGGSAGISDQEEDPLAWHLSCSLRESLEKGESKGAKRALGEGCTKQRAQKCGGSEEQEKARAVESRACREDGLSQIS